MNWAALNMKAVSVDLATVSSWKVSASFYLLLSRLSQSQPYIQIQYTSTKHLLGNLHTY